jgi:hypothetical protein
MIESSVLDSLLTNSSAEAWKVIIDIVLQATSQPLSLSSAVGEVVKRDRDIGELDNFLSSAGWDLWDDFGDAVERTSYVLSRWWIETHSAKAVLILDGLSLRELPWLLQGAEKHGFAVHRICTFASELPGETNEFAKSLGFSNRSQLQNNGATGTHSLRGAYTESVDMPWMDCESLINASSDWMFWHHWPDSKIHAAAVAGQGLETLSLDVAEQLCSDDFWGFVGRLATGRRLVITSDHGYAATGYFPDVDGTVASFLKTTFASGRSTHGAGDVGPFVPPVVMQLATPHGTHRLAIGRRKWKSQGGYPTLAHGGLSLLEVLSPFVEITK